MKVERHAEAGSFLARAGAFLLADDPVNGMVYGIAQQVESGSRYGDGAPSFYTVSSDHGVVLAALCTPPYSMVTSAGPGEAAEALAQQVARAAGALEVPGVAGPHGPATALARALAAHRGKEVEERLVQDLFTIRDVQPPRPGPGRARRANPRDRPLLLSWFRDFDREAVGDDVDSQPNVDRHLAAESAFLYEDDGQVVSMLVAQRTTERGGRIGAVYTPLGLRGHGYASRLVAAITQRRLDEGAEYMSLFADLSNPTSNAIYRALGYESVERFTVIDVG